VVTLGEWQFKGWLGDEWRWHVNKPWDAPGWLPARVPGSVVDDLVHAGEVPTPYFERNSRLSEWVAERTWIYRTRVRGGVVEFEGVDHEATVFVDGEEVAHHVGAFTQFRVEIPDGEHLLAVAVHAAPESEAQVGRTSRVHVHKPRMNYGWDFCPRLVHQGIWRPVTVDAPPRVCPRVTLVDGVGRVELGGEVVLEVEQPELWWPNGMGAQRLYRAGDFDVGFRTVELTPEYELVVNGARTEIRGWNWVPIDVLYGVPRAEKLQHLLELAARENVNLLRVWGGGLIETDEFYAHCDRLGLLVWQEFSQSSSGLESVPSDDPEFVATLAADAREIVPRLAWHPSLAIWCGGNELDADDSHPALATLRGVVHELDPGRAWLPTSPLGELDVHGPWEHQGLRKHHEHYDTRTSRLHSEFGVEGMTNRRALEEVVAADHRWPADRSNAVYEHLGAWWNNAPLVQDCFGGRIDDVDTMRRASQWLQYEGLRYAVEATRRRGAGTIPWQFNEPFPNAWCTSAIDWHGEPKPAYFGVARAYRGAPSAQFETCAWGGVAEVRARVSASARLLDLDGRVVAESEGGEIAAPLDAFAYDVFILDVGGNRYVMTRTENLAPLLDLPRTTLRLSRASNNLQLSSNKLLLANVGEVAAIGVVTDGDVLELLPGEEVAIEGERAEGWNARL
jgi:beta-mannosidase